MKHHWDTARDTAPRSTPNRGLPKQKAYCEKKLIQTSPKRNIAGETVRLISPPDTILLGAGTTTSEMACLLKDMPGVNAVTSDLHSAVELGSAEGEVLFIGGEIEKEPGRSAGPKAIRFPSDIQVDTVFLGICAISDDLTLGSHTFDNAALKRIFLSVGTRKVLLADADKFRTRAFAQVGPLSLVDCLVAAGICSEA